MYVGPTCVKHKRVYESIYANVCEVVLRNERYVYVTMQCVKKKIRPTVQLPAKHEYIGSNTDSVIPDYTAIRAKYNQLTVN